MKPCCARLAFVLCLVGVSIISSAQTPAGTSASSGASTSQASAVAQLVKFADIVGVTFALYQRSAGRRAVVARNPNVRDKQRTLFGHDGFHHGRGTSRRRLQFWRCTLAWGATGWPAGAMPG
jgi:hypothetical protein